MATATGGGTFLCALMKILLCSLRIANRDVPFFVGGHKKWEKKMQKRRGEFSKKSHDCYCNVIVKANRIKIGKAFASL